MITYLDYFNSLNSLKTTLLKGAHFLVAQMAVLSSSFSVFTVLGICNFGCELGLFISLLCTGGLMSYMTFRQPLLTIATVLFPFLLH
jgi:hypothetical protein